jgi:hypothetical protein
MKRATRKPRNAAAAGERLSAAFAALEPVILVVIAALSGAALWYAIRFCQGAIRPALSLAPELVSLAVNAGIEESLRLALALAVALAVRRLGLEPGAASLGVVSACVLAALENAGYLAAFPTLDSYWRLGYALPIHAGAAALYAIAAGPPRPERLPAGIVAGGGAARRPSPETRRSLGIAAAFASAWAWHASFNAVAALAPFPALPVIGTALNLLALSALVAASALRYGYWSVYAAR